MDKCIFYCHPGIHIKRCFAFYYKNPYYLYKLKNDELLVSKQGVTLPVYKVTIHFFQEPIEVYLKNDGKLWTVVIRYDGDAFYTNDLGIVSKDEFL